MPVVGVTIISVVCVFGALDTAICHAVLSEGRQSWAAERLSRGVECIFSNALGWLSYPGTVMQDVDAADRLPISGVNTNDLEHPDVDLADGPKIKVANPQLVFVTHPLRSKDGTPLTGAECCLQETHGWRRQS